MAARLWVALDVPDVQQADGLLDTLAPHRDIKIGMELFYRAGPAYVESLARRDFRIFLDLKCHDIARTVGRAVAAVRDLGVELLTVHAAGGMEMLNAAQENAGSLQLVAVTALTSLSQADWDGMGLGAALTHFVRQGTLNACRVGLAGVVVSSQEAHAMRELWPEARVVVPGIRLAGDAWGDQARVDTPAAAVRAGATDLVVGRAIVGAVNPGEALARYRTDMQQGGQGYRDDEGI